MVAPGHPTGPVLVVDDDPDIREALCELLEDEGYRAVSASNGREALVYLSSKERPCIILLDLMMPIMDGWEFRRRQQADPAVAHVPVIVLSALDSGRAMNVSANAFLKKPLDFDRLITLVRNYCH